MASVTISRKDVEGFQSIATAAITDVEELSSYNWIESPTPTIVVPGYPPLWAPPTRPQQLQKDNGHIYIAQNAARHPDSPLEPLFRALLLIKPAFNIRSVDIVTDRNNLRKLLSFVSNGQSPRQHEGFTIKFELVSDTLIMCRDAAVTEEFIGPDDFRGFGHEFEKAYTASQISNSTGHHRILSYRFANMVFLIRHETDGHVHQCSDDPSHENQLADLVANLSLSTAGDTSYSTFGDSKLKVGRSGQQVPLASTLEIKTRALTRRIEFSDVAAQLWISQTPNLVRAYHRGGKFETPQVENVALKLKQWEVDRRADLARLGELIKQIASIARSLGGKMYGKYNPSGDELVFEETHGEPMLPPSLYTMWTATDSNHSSTEPCPAITPMRPAEDIAK